MQHLLVVGAALDAGGSALVSVTVGATSQVQLELALPMEQLSPGVFPLAWMGPGQLTSNLAISGDGTELVAGSHDSTVRYEVGVPPSCNRFCKGERCVLKCTPRSIWLFSIIHISGQGVEDQAVNNC